mmetsp:Transcript_54016/g.128685  ORF Transcript_54016/g.128685 Transcript_54016/m.128685 type:complete len:525 (-) Transcript_54016:74-1648(-)
MELPNNAGSQGLLHSDADARRGPEVETEEAINLTKRGSNSSEGSSTIVVDAPGDESNSSGLTDLLEDAVDRNAEGVRRRRQNGERHNRIAFLSNGTFGDIRPFVEVALLLRERGYEVALFTNANLIEYCHKRGLRAVPTFADNQELLHTAGGLSGRNMFDHSKEFLHYAAKWREENASTCRPWLTALNEFAPDVIVCGSNSWGHGMQYESAKQVPAINVFMNRQSLDAFDVTLLLKPPRPVIMAVSELVDPTPLPQVAHMYRTSEWAPKDEHRSNSSGFQALADAGSIKALEAFLARCRRKSERPVVIGWGSMIPREMSGASLLGLALRSLKRARKPGVVVGGWAQLDKIGQAFVEGKLADDPEFAKDHQALAEFALENVCFVSSAPHEWLFRQAACIVHHGGNGTTHAALRSGRGQVVVPVFGDQFDNALAIKRLQVGSAAGNDETVPIQRLKPAEVAGAILLASSPEVEMAASEIALKMQEDDGAAEAASLIATFVEHDLDSGNWHRALEQSRPHVSEQPPS